jgi:enoyl-CoA hydratase/3-hydroxyacyl-CoA dehydrogenase
MGPFALMNATGIPIAYHCTVSFEKSKGAFYGAADGLAAQFEKGDPWDLEGEVEEGSKAVIGERLTGVVFGIASQLVEEGVASVEDIERGALVGLRWVRGPFGMMNDVGTARALELVESVTAKHTSFTVSENLRQLAAAGDPWEIRDVKLEVRNDIATIRMSRPEAMNALNAKVLKELKATVAQVREDSSIRAVIITGEGPAFVAGADIKAMLAGQPKEVEEFTSFGQEVMNDIERLDKAVIAAINGYALGGGLELALACDIRLASSEARMGFPEVGLGIFPGFGGTQRAPRLVGKGHACELIFTGYHIDAEEAERIGLVNRVVHPRQLMNEAWKLAQRIARQGPIAVAQAKIAILETLQTSQDKGMLSELKGMMTTFGSEDQKEGMMAFIEKRKPEFRGK